MLVTSAVQQRSPVRPNEAALPTPFAPWPRFDAEDISAVAAVLESGRVNYWTGEEGRRFEKEFAEAVGCRHGVALANGSVALGAALRATGICPGGDVVVTSRSFGASAASAVSVGGGPGVAAVDDGRRELTQG